jgi:putative pyruvate formate lyase activating enzyme
MPENPYISRIAPHYWEEPVISGDKGTVAVFFTGCTLNCIYCQNNEISQQHKGVPMSTLEIAEKINNFIQQGCHTLSFITPTHYADKVIEIIEIVKPTIPVVYNTGGYEALETLKMLNGYIDIYLPDFKYISNELGWELSKVRDYFDVAKIALEEMVKQTGAPEINSQGILTKGTVVRNLVLPAYTRNSIEVIDFLSKNYSDKILFSLMGQYVPYGQAVNHPKLNRKITSREYNKVLQAFENSNLEGFCQELSSADEKYIPRWGE